MASTYENIRVSYVATIANKNAPTEAEIAAGTLLAGLKADGVNLPTNQNMVDTFDISERFDTQEPGSFGGPVTLQYFRRKGGALTNTYQLLELDLTGFLVVGFDGSNGTAGDIVSVYPIMAHQPTPNASARNEQVAYTCTCAVYAPPAYDVAVV